MCNNSKLLSKTSKKKKKKRCLAFIKYEAKLICLKYTGAGLSLLVDLLKENSLIERLA